MKRSFTLFVLLVLLTLSLACNEDPPSQRIPDTGAAVDAASDTGDGATDTGLADTAQTDTGSMVECTAGEDCDSGVCDAASGSCVEATCEDGVQNQDESDVDCGGDTCEACADTKACSEADDCQSGVCEQGQCAAPDCEDGVKNGTETDVDCGGADSGCAGCANQKACQADGDCQSGVCDDESGGESGESAICVAATCTDGAKNGGESDVDCGGPDCGPCEVDEACSAKEDCASGVCSMGKCQAPSCDDGVKNGSETGADCGGKDCGACGAGRGCASAEDCQSGVCDPMKNICAPASCDDSVKNGNESDVDCGGTRCEACSPGSNCGGKADCASGVCKGGACAAPSCSDGVKNGQETDTDCGGANSGCTACPTGQSCSQGSDCSSKICQMGTCAAPSCMDGVKNAGESDVDCGGPNCGVCAVGDSCDDGGDCSSQVCKGGKCAAPTCADGKQNGSETDTDCGGKDCNSCPTGGGCAADGDCQSGVCANNSCQAPTCSDGVNNGQETDVDCGGNCGPCADGKACKAPGDCTSGVCASNVCQVPDCTDKTKNGQETDVDCGGPSCGGCGLGASCSQDGDCQSNICQSGTCDVCRNGQERKNGNSCGFQTRGEEYDVCQGGTWSATTCKDVWYKTCAEIHQDQPGATDGVYTIDPDGPGGSNWSSMRVWCDMTRDGGGWTLIGDFAGALELHVFDPRKHQVQSKTDGKTVQSAPELWKGNTSGHLAFNAFPVKSRDLKMECREKPQDKWYSVTHNNLFDDWSNGDKGSYGANSGWGTLRWTNGRSSHWVCGRNVNNNYPGIAYCKGPGSGGSWKNHDVSISFDPAVGYDGGTPIGCNGKGADFAKGTDWRARIWIR